MACIDASSPFLVVPRLSLSTPSMAAPSFPLFLSFLFLSLTTPSLSLPLHSLQSIQRFRQYLRVPTVHPNPDYRPALQFLLSQTESLRPDSTHVVEFVPKKPVLVLTWNGTDPSLSSILLNSHMDVVAVEKEKWKYDPFAAVMEENGNIYGRGAQDMKCVGIQYLEAIRNLQQEGFRPLRNIHVSFVPDEEIGGRDGFGKFFSSSLFASLNVGIGLDESGVSSSPKYNLLIGERSPWWLVIKALGASGHGSTLYDNSALQNLVKSLDAITRFRASQFDLIKAGLAKTEDVISVNPVFLKAGLPTPTGFSTNIQPSEASAGFDIRVPPLADSKALEKRIADEWAPAARNMIYKFVQKEKNHGITPTDTKNPWWELLVKAVSEAGGELGRPQISGAFTDARFVRGLGIPAFGFSPIANTTPLSHSHNEYLNAEQFLKGIKVYEKILHIFATSPGSDCKA